MEKIIDLDNFKIHLHLLNIDLDRTYKLFELDLYLLHIVSTTKKNDETLKIIDASKPQSSFFKIIASNIDYFQVRPEYVESKTRYTFLSGLYRVISYYSVILKTILEGHKSYEPCFNTTNANQPLNYLSKLLTKDEKDLISFFHSFRNSMAHYDGNHNLNNKLNYKLGNTKFETRGKDIGKQISWGIEDIFELYDNLRLIYKQDKILNNAVKYLTEKKIPFSLSDNLSN